MNNESEENTSNIEHFQIFVGGCHPELTLEQLHDYFSQFGKVFEHRLVYDKLTGKILPTWLICLGKFRGFGFVTFENSKIGMEVLGSKDNPRKHILMGKQIQLKQAFSKEQTRLKLLDEQKRKLYIENIPEELFKEHFEKYFKVFGELEEIRVIHDKRKNGTKKNFCFILFKKAEGLNNLLVKGSTHTIEGHVLECRQTKLREELKAIQLQKQKEMNNKVPLEGNNKPKKRKRKKKKNKQNQNKKVQLEEDNVKNKPLVTINSESFIPSAEKRIVSEFDPHDKKKKVTISVPKSP